MNVPQVARPALGQAPPPRAEVQAAAEAVAAAERALRNIQQTYMKLSAIIGPEKANQAIEEAKSKLQMVQEEYQGAIGP